MTIINSAKMVVFMFISFAVATKSHANDNFSLSQKLDMEFRFDERSSHPFRQQYRLRYTPSLTLSSNDHWSLNGYVVTGNKFSSGHNTLGSDASDYLYIRNLYVRYANSNGKWELGVIPTYKDKVSSSGLSKDGWIKGVRRVLSIQQGSNIEFVVGELNNTHADHALDSLDKINYAELEYSTHISKTHSIELSIERMMDNNFARGEYRWHYLPTHTLFIEMVQSISQNTPIYVLGMSGQFALNNHPLSYFAHYSYVGDDFGLRAELSEDYLGYGHGISIEVGGYITQSKKFRWFVRTDTVGSSHRLMAGVKMRLTK